MTPLVSIIIPYYNRPIKLERCLKSVFSQSYTCFEIIVVDDCSTVPYLKKHQNANYLKNEINSGPGVSRNRGMYEAKGTYIAFLDCDDYWHPNFLEVLVSTLEYNANSVMAYALGSNVDAAESIISDHRKTIKKGRDCILPDILFSARAWGTGACLWRANIIKDTKWIATRNWEDYAFEASVAVKNNNIVCVNQKLVFFDASGDNKLSKQNAKTVTIEKNKSILDISNTLKNAGLEKDTIIKKSITILILLSIVQLKKYKVRRFKLFYKNIKSLQKWRSKRFSIYVFLICFFHRKLSKKYLLRLKRRVNQDRIQLLGK